jgi:hypothetical protein
MGLVKQLPIKMIVGSLMQQYISKNVKSMENKIVEKIQDLQYKTLYEEQLKINEQQMKINAQTMNLLKFIIVMQVLITICVIIRLFY